MSEYTAIPLVGNSDYDALPESVKAQYTFEQYQWFSGAEKANLVQTNCDPECEL